MTSDSGWGPPAPRWGAQRPTLSGHPRPPTRPMETNGLATASLVCGILGLFTCLLGIPAIIFGVIAKKQIRRSHGMETGRGMATAGIVLGSILPAVFL